MKMAIVYWLIIFRLATFYGTYHHLLVPPDYQVAELPAIVHHDTPPPPPPGHAETEDARVDKEEHDKEWVQEQRESEKEFEEQEYETGKIALQTNEEILKRSF